MIPAFRVRVTSLLLGVAISAAAHGDLHEKILALDRDIATHATPDLLQKRAELQRLHGDMPAAAADAAAALKLAPDLQAARLTLSACWLEMGRIPEALAEVEVVLRADPAPVLAHVVRARCRAVRQEFRLAADDFRTACRLSRSPDPDLILEWALAEERTDAEGPQRALAALKTGLEMTGPCLAIELEALRLETVTGKTDAALERLSGLAQRSPHPGGWMEKRGDLLAASGRRVEARQSYEKGLQELDALPERVRERPANRALAVRLREKSARQEPSSSGPP